MARKKQQKTESKAVSVARSDQAVGWDVFFSRQRSPVLRSQLITALMSGHPLEVERLPSATLLDAVVLSTAARVHLEAEIIDDYTSLLERTNNVWKDPMWTCRVFDQYHMSAASFMLMGGAADFACKEDEYVPEFVQWLLEHESPEYFSKELV